VQYKVLEEIIIHDYFVASFDSVTAKKTLFNIYISIYSVTYFWIQARLLGT